MKTRKEMESDFIHEALDALANLGLYTSDDTLLDIALASRQSILDRVRETRMKRSKEDE